jgi:hypothetical protein
VIPVVRRPHIAIVCEHVPSCLKLLNKRANSPVIIVFETRQWQKFNVVQSQAPVVIDRTLLLVQPLQISWKFLVPTDIVMAQYVVEPGPVDEERPPRCYQVSYPSSSSFDNELCSSV